MIDYRILGPLEVSADGRVIEIGGPKLRALLVILLLRANEAVPRDVLVHELWGEQPPDGAQHTLDVYVSRLRKALDAAASGPVVVTRAGAYRLQLADGARCNASVTSGCGSTPPTVTTGANPQFVAVDPASGTAFVMNQGDNALSAINTSTCNGTVTSGCPNRAPGEQASPDTDPGYNPFPNAFALVPQTSTAYVVNVGGAPVMSVVSVSRCDATATAGCRAEAPAVPAREFLISADPATGTIYAGNTTLPQIDVLNAATCNAGNLAGAARATGRVTTDRPEVRSALAARESAAGRSSAWPSVWPSAKSWPPWSRSFSTCSRRA